MAEHDRPSVLYVEDDADIAAMSIEMLSDSYRIEHAADAETGRALALSRRFDVMVVDRRLPGGDGVELVRAVRRAHLTTPILLLTALGTVADRVDGLDAGANDYLVKPFDYDELNARLRALVRGFRSQAVRREIGDWLFAADAGTLFSPYGARIALTDTEAALLRLLAESPDHVFGRDEILAAVFPGGEAANTVDTYVHYLRRKATPELVETVRGRGYRIGTPR